ncbi:hypothetical protein, partial [Escherichia coli]|uniref:hypothetical protein n=1 Tax=Escherichia coli TaxID=562 RepID=UPI001BC8A30F
MYYPNEIFSVFLIKSKAGAGGGDKKTAKNGGLVLGGVSIKTHELSTIKSCVEYGVLCLFLQKK